MNDERRKYPRVVYTAGVDIISTGNRRVLYEGLIKNVGLGGIVVETKGDLSIGDKFNFSFFLEKKNIKTTGKIVWEYRDKNSNYYGIQFIALGFFSKFRLKRFISCASVPCNEFAGADE